MKNLLIIRHAKASWDQPGLGDFDRPLNKRGEHDAPLMGQFLAREGLRPDLILTSPAVRAVSTAYAIARKLDMDDANTVQEPSIYAADVSDLLDVVRGIDDSFTRVFLIGHNPGLHDLVFLLTGHALPNLATCGVASVELGVERWRHTSRGVGTLDRYVTPKSLNG